MRKQKKSRAQAKKEPAQAKKEPAASYSRMGGSHTTLGEGALDFRVRNGNGYDNSSMATGKRMPFCGGFNRIATGYRDDRARVKKEPSRTSY